MRPLWEELYAVAQGWLRDFGREPDSIVLLGVWKKPDGSAEVEALVRGAGPKQLTRIAEFLLQRAGEMAKANNIEDRDW